MCSINHQTLIVLNIDHNKMSAPASYLFQVSLRPIPEIVNGKGIHVTVIDRDSDELKDMTLTLVLLSLPLVVMMMKSSKRWRMRLKTKLTLAHWSPPTTLLLCSLVPVPNLLKTPWRLCSSTTLKTADPKEPGSSPERNHIIIIFQAPLMLVTTTEEPNWLLSCCQLNKLLRSPTSTHRETQRKANSCKSTRTDY